MRVLLLSSNPDDKPFFEAACQLAEMTVQEVDAPEKVCDEITKDSSSIIVVDATTPEQYQAFEKAVAEKIGLFSALLNANRLFFVASKPFHDCQYLRQSEIFGHFIQRTFTEVDKALMGRLFKMTGEEKAFGIENYFSAEARSQTIKITKTLQKKVIVESLKNHLVKIGFKPRAATIIANAADELIMNAIFDAPVDELGRHIHNQTPRNAVFDLEEKNVVELKIIFDGKTLGLSVIDFHGSLDRRKLISQHLGRSYASTQYEAKAVLASAGLGLSQVYRNCGGIMFSCEAGGRTEVNLFYKKTTSFREFKDQFRFLSTFIYFS